MLVASQIVQHEYLPCPVGQAADRFFEVERELGLDRARLRRLERRTRVVANGLGVTRLALSQDEVHGEPVQPAPERSLTAEGAEFVPGADEHILRQIVRDLGAGHAPRKRMNPADVDPVQPFERPAVAARCQGHVGRFRVRRRSVSPLGRHAHPRGRFDHALAWIGHPPEGLHEAWQLGKIPGDMTPGILALSGIGLLLGFRHAFEPDHLAAVSTLATRQGSLFAACRLGLAWAVGHSASVGIVVFAIIAGGLHLPARLWPAADFLVGLLLVVLGGSVLWRYARGRWHMHLHAHGGNAHLHLHSHASGAAHQHTHATGDLRRSLGFGLLHGLAGSAAILVLLVAAAPTRTAQLAYFFAFALGTIVGMLVVSFSLAGIVRLASGRGARVATALHLGAAATSIVVGIVLARRMAGDL